MATKRKPAAKKTPAAAGGFLAGLLAILKSPAARQIAVWLLTLIAGGATVAYATKSAVDSQINDFRKGLGPRLRKLFEPKDAIVKINMAGSMCSATVIGPVNDDDVWIDLLTAAHCVKVGQEGTVTMANGEKLPFRCVTRAEKADVAWIRAPRPQGVVPHLFLADVTPPPGSPVWHQGFGIDRPRNKEAGEVVGVGRDNQQVTYRLSVSPGDSGGGIILTDDDKVISPVCCTTKLGGTGTVWGGTPYWCAKIRPKANALSEEGNPVHPILTTGETSGVISSPPASMGWYDPCPNGVCVRPILRRRS